MLLQVFLDSPSEETYGYALSKASGLPSGTIYPILERLERQGVIAARWEDIDEHAHGRRRRCYYRLTAEGAQVAREAVRKQAAGLRMLAPGWDIQG